jgi:Ca2+-binding EF-hand superfamily protein
MLDYGKEIDEQEVEEMIQMADSNRDGFINYRGFVDMVTNATKAKAFLNL